MSEACLKGSKTSLVQVCLNGKKTSLLAVRATSISVPKAIGNGIWRISMTLTCIRVTAPSAFTIQRNADRGALRVNASVALRAIRVSVLKALWHGIWRTSMMWVCNFFRVLFAISAPDGNVLCESTLHSDMTVTVELQSQKIATRNIFGFWSVFWACTEWSCSWVEFQKKKTSMITKHGIQQVRITTFCQLLAYFCNVELRICLKTHFFVCA